MGLIIILAVLVALLVSLLVLEVVFVLSQRGHAKRAPFLHTGST